MPSRNVVIEPDADVDIAEAALWYEDQREGLGGAFLAQVGRILERIAERPLQFPEVEAGTRRALLHQFPYGVYFLPRSDRISVHSVLHLHRRPDTWKQRQKGDRS